MDGDFYSNGECLNCGLPEGEAADLLAPLHNDNCLSYFIKQPKTEEEIDRAIWACKVCCVSALRYSGKDKSIFKNKWQRDYCYG